VAVGEKERGRRGRSMGIFIIMGRTGRRLLAEGGNGGNDSHRGAALRRPLVI
jgi:hypothetical protein